MSKKYIFHFNGEVGKQVIDDDGFTEYDLYAQEDGKICTADLSLADEQSMVDVTFDESTSELTVYLSELEEI